MRKTIRPSRAALIQTYWLDGFNTIETARKHRMSTYSLKRHFKRLGILARVRHGKKINALRLELMLWPSVVEYERERCKKLVR